MLDAVESGLISIWKEKYQAKTKACQITQPNDVIHAAMKPLELSDFYGVIATFGIGVAISLFVLFWEVLRRRGVFEWIQRIINPKSVRVDPVGPFFVEEYVAGRRSSRN